MSLYATITERTFTAHVVELAQRFGWLVVHFRPAKTSKGWRTAGQGDVIGFPDILAIRPGRAILAELKAAKGKVTLEQKRWLEIAGKAGFETYCWRPAMIEEIERVLR